MQIKKMCQPEAAEIANRWKYDGEYAFYDMTADPEDYAEIVTAEKRGDRYFSVFSGDGLMGFFCVEQAGADIEIGLGLRPDLTGLGNTGPAGPFWRKSSGLCGKTMRLKKSGWMSRPSINGPSRYMNGRALSKPGPPRCPPMEGLTTSHGWS